MFYWRIRTGPFDRGGTYTYVKTSQKYIPEMVVDLAVRDKLFLDVFVQEVDEVVQVTEEEYFKHMWE